MVSGDTLEFLTLLFSVIYSLMCVWFELKTDMHRNDIFCLMHSAFMGTNRLAISSICYMICLSYCNRFLGKCYCNHKSDMCVMT